MSCFIHVTKERENKMICPYSKIVGGLLVAVGFSLKAACSSACICRYVNAVCCLLKLFL